MDTSCQKLLITITSIILNIYHLTSSLETDIMPISQLIFINKREINVSCLGITPQPDTTYYWKKDGRRLEINGLSMQMYPGEGSLQFRMPQAADEGLYQCLAENVYGTSISHKVNFTAAVLKTFPTPGLEPTVERVRVGNSLKLGCQPPYSNPPATVYWGHNKDKSKLMPLTNDERVSLDFNGNLYFSNVVEKDLMDGDNYVCIADNKVLRILVQGSDFKIKPILNDGLLRAKGPKLMWKSGGMESGIYGHFKKIKCIFSGFPTPRISWKKKNGEALPSHVHALGQELHFKNVSYNDDGVYHCVATVPGVRKTASEAITLIVDAVPRWRSRGLEDVITSEDEDAEFSCTVFGSPRPVITWFINGVSIDKVNITNMVVDKEKYMLKFKKVTKKDFRVVQCLASNIHGSLFKNAYLKILAEEPEIVKPPETLKVAKGQTALLHCGFTGAPKPHNLWYRDEVVDGGDLDLGDKYDMVEDGDLQIIDVQTEDRGKYVCFVKNKFGNKTAVGKIIVLNKTRISTRPKDEMVTMGSDVTFECRADTDDRETKNLSIKWFFEGGAVEEMDEEFKSRHHMKDRNSKFTISKSQVDDSGAYSCVASNHIDHDKAQFKLVVRDRPSPPYNVKIDCSNSMAEVSWTQGSPNNEAITGFSVFYNTSHDDEGEYTKGCEAPVDKPVCSAHMYPWANFTFHVVAHNSLGVSDRSPYSLSTCTTKLSKPHRHPKSVCTISRKPGTLVIIWQPMVKKEHNGPNFHYLISYRRKDKTFQNIQQDLSNFTRAVVTDWRQNEIAIPMQPVYKTYEIFVEAVNEEGSAEETPERIIGFSSQDAPLEAPTNLMYLEDTLTSTNATFTFNGVDNDPDKMRGIFVGYELKYWKENDESSLQVKKLIMQEFKPCYPEDKLSRKKRNMGSSDNVQEITVDNLWPYTKVKAGVAVINGAKSSKLSNIITFTTPEGIPDDITEASVVEKGSHHIKVSWKPPKKLNGRFDGYLIVLKEKGSHESRYESVVVDFDQCYKKLHGLKSETDYEVELKAMNGLHQSNKAFHLHTSTVAVSEPDMPHIESILSGFDYANITWHSSKGEPTNPGKIYVIEYKKPGDDFWSETVSEDEHNWLNVSSLQHGIPYEFRVVAFNNNGDKMVSEALVHTIGAKPETAAQRSTMLSWLVPLILLFLLFFLLLLILLFFLCKRKAQSGHYRVSVKEKKFGVRYDEEATFDEYLRSENSTFKKVKQGSLEGSNKSSSEDGSDSLGAYDDVDPSKFNDEGSFVDQSCPNGTLPNGGANENVALMNFKMSPEA